MGTIWDHVELGRILRAARILAGHDSVAGAAAAFAERFPTIHLSRRTLAAIERGEQAPSLDLIAALMLLYEPPGGWSFTRRAVRPEYAEQMRRLGES